MLLNNHCNSHSKHISQGVWPKQELLDYTPTKYDMEIKIQTLTYIAS